jgi:hypothetical protein
VLVRVLSIPADADGRPDESRLTVVGAAQPTCRRTPTIHQLPIQLKAYGFVRLETVATPEAREQAGFAYQIVRHIEASRTSRDNAAAAGQALTSAVNARPPTVVTTELARSQTTVFRYSVASRGAEPVVVTCVGPGMVTMTITVTNAADPAGNPTELTSRVACTQGAQVVGLVADLTGPSSVTVQVQPDAAAWNRAGVAYLLPG